MRKCVNVLNVFQLSFLFSLLIGLIRYFALSPVIPEPITPKRKLYTLKACRLTGLILALLLQTSYYRT